MEVGLDVVLPRGFAPLDGSADAGRPPGSSALRSRAKEKGPRGVRGRLLVPRVAPRRPLASRGNRPEQSAGQGGKGGEGRGKGLFTSVDSSGGSVLELRPRGMLSPAVSAKPHKLLRSVSGPARKTDDGASIQKQTSS